MKKISLLTLLMAGVAPCFAAPASHCTAGEVSYFSCPIKNSAKVLSLCGSPGFADKYREGAQDAWLQYRFGKIGRPEFVYPRRKEGSWRLFTGFHSDHHPISATDAWGIFRYVSFKNGAAEYTIGISRYEGESYGVSVTERGKHVSLQCAGFSAARFGTEGDSNSAFSEVARVLPHD